jgi:cell division protein FtsI/penicillin-binding protein 2
MRLLRVLAAAALVASACSGDAEPVVTTAPTVPEATTTPTSAPETSIALDEDDRRAAEAIAESYLAAWAAGDWEAAAALTSSPVGTVRDAHEAWSQWLLVERAAADPLDSRIADDHIEVDFRMTVDVSGLGPWSYQGTVDLAERSGRWSVDWSPAILHPALDENDRITVERTWAARGAILAADGRSIVAGGEVHVIGVVPAWIEDLDTLLEALDTLVGIPPEVVTAELERPGVQPDWFLPVGDLSSALYDAVGADLEEVPGVLIRSGQTRLAIAEPFAGQIIGTTGPITAEQLEAFGPPYDERATVGRSGLEFAAEFMLAGTPAQEIRVVNQFGRVLEVLHRVEGTPPGDVHTTLEIEAQLAAEAAVDGTDLPVALVAVDVETAAVRAAAVRPSGGFDRAFSGLYPPGSTFKVVTLSALLADGARMDQVVECPAEVEILGRTFRNAGDAAYGSVTLAEAFAASCNTTFAWLAALELDEGDLTEWAVRYGYGQAPTLTVPAATSQFPAPPDLAERAAAAIGQGQVLVSPVHAASVAAAAVSGRWRSAHLTDDALPVQSPAMAETTTAGLTEGMLLTVTSGTGRPAAVAGETVLGKTGSAEFSTGDGIATHAWFIGAWNDLAFAVVVEGGGGGGSVAGPIAADFVERMIALRSG